MYEIQGNGELTPPGRPPVVLEHYFTSGAGVPAWLSVPEGIETITPHGLSSQGTISVLTATSITSVTVAAATDTLTKTAHGLANGARVKIKTALGNLALDSVYYVVEATANTFKLSLTSGGAAVDLTTDGTITVLGSGLTGGAARLQTLDVDPSRWACIDFRLIELSAGGTDLVDLACDMYFQARNPSGTPAGFDFKQLATEPNVVSQIAGVTSPVANAPAQVRATWRTQAEAKNRRTIGFLWYPQDKQVVLYEGDPTSERATRVHSGLSAANVVAPRFRMVTQEAAARSFSVAGVRLALHPF